MMRRILRRLLMAAALVFCCAAFAFAQSPEISFTKSSDKNGFTLRCEEEASSLYMIFDSEPGAYTVNGREVEHPYFLHKCVDISPSREISISGALPKEIHAFAGDELPSWVQRWEPPCERADLLLISSHADDEQLFFAGILPYYAAVRGYEVQVAYATEHNSQPVRHHERLNGLWAVSIRHYPVFGGYNDMYSESYEQALLNLKPYGVSEEDVIEWEKSLIRRFSPQVIVTHDLEGEYGHGMHRLVSGALKKAVDSSESFPSLKKVYFHLYNGSGGGEALLAGAASGGDDQNASPALRLNCLDESFDALGGLSPFQMTQQKGFSCHESQHWTWFKRWIYGKDGNISKAAEIERYSPLLWGCYYSAVGPDIACDDFFENVPSYEELRLAEEKRLEEERLEQERLAAEAAAAAEAAEKQAAKRKSLVVIFVLLAVAASAVFALSGRGKWKSKNRRK